MPSASSSSASPKKPPLIPYKFIHFRKTTCQTGFLVQHGGRLHGGFHPTLKAAVACLRDVLSKLKPPVTELPRRSTTSTAVQSKAKKAYYGISYHKRLKKWVGNTVALGATFDTPEAAYKALLQKKPAAKACRAYRRPKISAAELVDRSKKLSQWGEMGPHLYLPPDLLASIKHAKLSRKMFQAEVGLEMLSLHLKYEPWKEALLQSWVALGS